jgi:nicotinamidase-related amidase
MSEELRLDPKHTALVLIDLQHGIVARQLAPYPGEEVVKNCAHLADALRSKGGTVIFVRVLVAEILSLPVDAPTPRPSGTIPANAWEIVPETGRKHEDIVVSKRQWGAFYGTDLDQQLRRRKIQTVILGGIATNFGVESTARAAFDRSYELVFAEDAMSGINAEAHGFAVTIIFPKMGRVRSTEQIVNGLKT